MPRGVGPFKVPLAGHRGEEGGEPGLMTRHPKFNNTPSPSPLRSPPIAFPSFSQYFRYNELVECVYIHRIYRNGISLALVNIAGWAGDRGLSFAYPAESRWKEGGCLAMNSPILLASISSRLHRRSNFMCIYSFIRGGIAVLAFTMRIFNKWAGKGGREIDREREGEGRNVEIEYVIRTCPFFIGFCYRYFSPSRILSFFFFF